MLTVRRVGLAILAGAAVAVFFVMTPDEAEPGASLPIFAPEGRDYVELLDQSLADYDANNERADSAPQQQVVNGWVAKDLLSILVLASAQNVNATQIIAEQNELLYAAATEPAQRDDRPAALLVIGILAVALWGATTPPIQLPEPDSNHATGHIEPAHTSGELTD